MFNADERGRDYAPQGAATAVVGPGNAQYPALLTKLPQAPALLPSIPGLSSVCVCKAAPLLRGIIEGWLVCCDIVCLRARVHVSCVDRNLGHAARA